MELTGLHHVTAVTGLAAQNVEFYTQLLGLRLVKKTVNQDDVRAYHLFYGDAVGSPGTEVTFFDWPAAAQRLHGTGTIAEIALRVEGPTVLDAWTTRLAAADVPYDLVNERYGRRTLTFSDPEGQRLALIDDDSKAAGPTWDQSPVPAEIAIRGLHSVTTVVRQLEPTAHILTEVLGLTQVGQYSASDNSVYKVHVFAFGQGGAGAELHVAVRPDLRRGHDGRGGVHHVAFRTPNDKEQQYWQERLAQAGMRVTEIIDRFYFKSIYFREPGGVLFEIATDGPGFATDEDPAHLGERLALPPFLEGRRAEIEAGLKPIE